MPNDKKPSINTDDSLEGDIETIDIDFFELFEVLAPKDITKLLNAVGGSFTSAEGSTIKKLVEFINQLDDDQIDNLIEAFDNIMSGK